jgi:hypothetical protein
VLGDYLQARRELVQPEQVGQNRHRAVFLDPAEKALYPDWDRATARLVAGFRESVGSDADDLRFVQLVGARDDEASSVAGISNFQADDDRSK